MSCNRMLSSKESVLFDCEMSISIVIDEASSVVSGVFHQRCTQKITPLLRMTVVFSSDVRHI